LAPSTKYLQNVRFIDRGRRTSGQAVAVAVEAGEPVISVDAKKRELIGASRRSAASFNGAAASSTSGRCSAAVWVPENA
jgi:hypothetical protein